MKTAIVIVNYNDYETTKDFLKSIKNYKILDLIVVVDNNSTDDSYKLLKKLEKDNIVVLKAQKNGGYGYGNNIGIKYAIKKLKECNIIISNPDIIVKEKTIKRLLKVLNLKKEYAIVGPIINTRGILDKGWRLSTGFEELLLTIPKYGTKNRNKIIGYNNDYYDKEVKEVDVVSGCFFITKANCFKEIKYFDENLFLYYEENVISKKLKDRGYKIVLDTSSEIIHNHSVSINKTHSSYSKYKALKESQKYYLDNYCKANILTKFIIRIIVKLTLLIKKK